MYLYYSSCINSSSSSSDEACGVVGQDALFCTSTSVLFGRAYSSDSTPWLLCVRRARRIVLKTHAAEPRRFALVACADPLCCVLLVLVAEFQNVLYNAPLPEAQRTHTLYIRSMSSPLVDFFSCVGDDFLGDCCCRPPRWSKTLLDGDGCQLTSIFVCCVCLSPMDGHEISHSERGGGGEEVKDLTICKHGLECYVVPCTREGWTESNVRPCLGLCDIPPSHRVGSKANYLAFQKKIWVSDVRLFALRVTYRDESFEMMMFRTCTHTYT